MIMKKDYYTSKYRPNKFQKIFNILENSGEDIKLQVNDDNRAFYRIIKNKDFDFLIKDLLENNK